MIKQEVASMHPRYQEFLKFMADCPHRKTPSTLETAFWAWFELIRVQEWFSECPDPRDQEIQILKNDLDRLHRERDSFQQQSSAMASENERLNDELTHIKSTIAGFLL